MPGGSVQGKALNCGLPRRGAQAKPKFRFPEHSRQREGQADGNFRLDEKAAPSVLDLLRGSAGGCRCSPSPWIVGPVFETAARRKCVAQDRLRPRDVGEGISNVARPRFAMPRFAPDSEDGADGPPEFIDRFLFRTPLAIAALLAARKLVELPIAARLLGRLPAGAWRPIFDRASFRTMLRQSATLSAAQVTYSTALSIGSPLVNAAFGLEGLGLYRAAFDLAGKIAFVSNGITLIVFPKAARRFATRAPREGDAALYSSTLSSSVTLYACFAAIAVFLAPNILPAIGLGDPATIRLFILLIVALSINAHSQISNELIQACGRYRYSILFSVSLLGVLTLIFLLARPAGLMAIGWAWLVAALVTACVADGLLLKACLSGAARRAVTVGVTIAAALASSGLALAKLAMVAGPVAAVCGFVLAALLVFAVRRTPPLLRSWREELPAAAASV